MEVHHPVREREPEVVDSNQEAMESAQDLRLDRLDHKASWVESLVLPARKSCASVDPI